MKRSLAPALHSALLAGILVCGVATADGSAGATSGFTNTLMPMPATISWSDGSLTLPASLKFNLAGGDTARLSSALERWESNLHLETGGTLAVSPSATAESALLRLNIREVGTAYPSITTNDTYRLSIDDTGIEIHADTSFGALHALQTLRQLAENCGSALCLPHVSIRDVPRFRWRGYMLDVVRHFMPIETVQRQLDSMAALKLNVFHWHLSDDQSFRVETKVFPLLHQKGSDGDYYTQEQIREVVEYAADRGIRVVPELDLPGHSRSWQIAYPELSSVPGKEYELYSSDGIFSDPLNPAPESTYIFLAKLIEELSALFPDDYFHLGGDEVSYSAWEDNDDITRFMAEQKLENPEALQAYFIQRYAALLIEAGKLPIGWNEVLHPDLPPTVALHAWNGMEFPKIAARHDVVVSTHYYLDHFGTAEFHYRADPTAFLAGGTRIDDAQLLGIESPSWAEVMSPRNVDIVAWPRLAAIAERAWSPAQYTDAAEIGDVYRRMRVVDERLHRSGSPHRRNRAAEFKNLAGQGDPDALAALAEAVTAVPFYFMRDWSMLGRLFLPSLLGANPNEPFQPHPFTRVLPYESLVAWDFSRAVDSFAAEPTQDEAAGRLLADLRRWSGAHERVLRIVATSPELEDQGIGALSQAVKEVAEIGIALVEAHRDEAKIDERRLAAFRGTLAEHEAVQMAFDRNYLLHFLKGMLRPIALRQHTIAIQPGVQKLLDAYEMRPAS